MHINTPIIRFVVAALVVASLGALAGWFLFVRGQISDVEGKDTARGFNAAVPFGAETGSGISNLAQGIVDTIIGNAEPAASTAPKLWRITRTPVAGLGFASSTPTLYFAERASGNVLTAEARETKVSRLTNTLVPHVLEALFARDGSVILRFLDETGEINTVAATIATSTSATSGDAPRKLEQLQLPGNIISIDVHPTRQEITYVLREGDGAAIYSANWKPGSQKRLLSSALSDWHVLYGADATRYIAQKASDFVRGYTFEIKSEGRLERAIANMPGLSILPRTNSQIVYSRSEDVSVSLYARIGSAADTRLTVRTVAEKCVWAPGTRLILYCAAPQTLPSRTFLLDWYDGSVHTSDAWWKIDVSANTAERIFTPDTGTLLDVKMPHIDSSGRYIGFINGGDMTLWMLTLDS